MSTVELIVARGNNGVIGCDGKMPWHIPEDLRHFKTVTMGCPVVMGRRTWESIGRALPGRRNVVLTHQSQYEAQGAEVVSSFDEALEMLSDTPRIFVIGGAEIYRQTLSCVSVAWITQIDASPAGDAFFEELPDQQWSRELLKTLPACEKHPAVHFYRCERRNP